MRIDLLSQKLCDCCKERSALGMYLPIPNKQNYQRFICNNCIIKGTSALVKNALKINKLTASQVEQLQPAITTPRPHGFGSD